MSPLRRWWGFYPGHQAAFSFPLMASSLPWFPLMCLEWLALRMTPEQKGALMDLRAIAWLADPPCTLPDDDEQLAEISGLRERWATVGKPIRAMLRPVVEYPGRLIDTGLYATYLRQTARQATARKAGKASGERRGNGRSTNPERIGNGMPTSLSSISYLTTREEIIEEGQQTSNGKPTEAQQTAWLLAHPGERIPEWWQ